MQLQGKGEREEKTGKEKESKDRLRSIREVVRERGGGRGGGREREEGGGRESTR